MNKTTKSLVLAGVLSALVVPVFTAPAQAASSPTAKVVPTARESLYKTVTCNSGRNKLKGVVSASLTKTIKPGSPTGKYVILTKGTARVTAWSIPGYKGKVTSTSTNVSGYYGSSTSFAFTRKVMRVTAVLTVTRPVPYSSISCSAVFTP